MCRLLHKISWVDTPPIQIDGVRGPIVVSTSAFFGGVSVAVSGVPARRIDGRQFALPASAGGILPAKVHTTIADPYPTVEINGVKHRTGPAVPAGVKIAALLPFLLAFIGSLLGGVLGALALAVNLVVARTRLSPALKLLITIGVTVVVFGIWLPIAWCGATSSR